MNDSKKPAERQMSILCVEDDQDTCELIGIILAGYRMVFANSTREVLDLIETQDFDLIIMDNWLPDGSGIELCRRMRDGGINVPIIFASGVGQASEIKKAMDAGAQAYLVKPYEPEKLQKIVKDLIERK